MIPALLYSVYPVIIYTLPIADSLPIKMLVARQMSGKAVDEFVNDENFPIYHNFVYCVVKPMMHMPNN